MTILDDIYKSGGFLKDPCFKAPYETFMSNSPQSTDKLWFDFHIAMHDLANPKSEGWYSGMSRSRLTGLKNKLDRLVTNYTPISFIETLLPSIEELYYNSTPVDLPFEDDSRFALEACVGRAIEGIKSSIYLHSFHLVDAITCLAASLEALLLFQYLYKNPMKVSSMKVAELAERYNNYKSFQKFYQEEPTERYFEELSEIEQEFRSLGGVIKDDKARSPQNPSWRGLAECDDFSTPAFADKQYLAYVHIFDQRNYVAHCLPTCWKSFVKTMDSTIAILPQQCSIPPTYPIYSLQVFGKLMMAIQKTRDESSPIDRPDYELLAYLWMIGLDDPESAKRPYFQ
jgi:hypothetical protein